MQIRSADHLTDDLLFRDKTPKKLLGQPDSHMSEGRGAKFRIYGSSYETGRLPFLGVFAPERKITHGSRATRCVCEKIAQNFAQPFLSKLMHNVYCGRQQPKILGYFFIVKNLPKVSNRPIGEKLTNPVTLHGRN
jgi:hypothetical protein